MLVYDITSRESFDSAATWLEECKVNGNPEMLVVLVGNKTDLSNQRQVSHAEGAAFAQKNGMIFIETSAKSDMGIKEAFKNSAGSVNTKIKEGVIDPKNETFGVKLGPVYNVTESSFLKQAQSQPQKGGDCC